MVDNTRYSFIVLIVVFFSIFIFDIHASENVNSLIEVNSEAEFSDYISSYKNSLLLFSRKDENCIECQIAKKEIEKITSSFTHDECIFLFINCASRATASICQHYELQKLPTLSLSSENLAVYDYNEYVISESIIKFIEKYSIPKTTVIQSEDELTALIESNRVFICGFFLSNTEALEYRKTAAYLIYDYLFAEMFIDNDEKFSILEKYDITPNNIVLFKQIAGEKSSISILSSISQKKIISWIQKYSPALLYKGTNENFERMVERKKPIFSIFFSNSEKSPENRDVFQSFELNAESFRDSLSSSYSILSDEVKEQYQDLKRWGFSLSIFPIMLIYNPITREVFPFSEAKEINFETMNEFCKNYFSGKLSPHLIRQPLPVSSPNSPVQIVVYDNYRKIVHNHEKDVAVLFYLPEDRCLHCAQFLSVFEAVADHIHHTLPNLVFAKMNMYENESAPGLNVHIFPSLIYFPKNDKYNETHFTAKRNFDNVVNWVKQQYESSLFTESKFLNLISEQSKTIE